MRRFLRIFRIIVLMKGLKIAVLVKQVTDTRETVEAKVGADGTIDRNALPAICNPDDLNALEQALRLKDRIAGSRVVLISMGPQRAEEVPVWAPTPIPGRKKPITPRAMP